MNPKWLWRVVNVGFVMTLALVGGLLGAALAGVGDPRPLGRLVWEDAPGAYTLDEPGSRLTPSLPRTFTPPGTLELVAQQAGGPGEAAYGLWWGEVRTMVSGSGYVGVWVGEEPLYAWQPFPHVRGPGGENRIQMMVGDGQMTVRLNDEIVVEGALPAAAPAEVGVRIETFERGGAVIDFEWIRIWEN